MKNILNSQGMKIYNRKAIIRQIMMQACSRADLARMTGLTRAGISKIIDELIEREILIEEKSIIDRAGRNPILLSLNPQIYSIACISLERDYCSVSICDFSGSAMYLEHIPASRLKTAAEGLGEIRKKIDQGLEATGSANKVLGIGVIAPGPLDREQGRILNPPNFSIWHQCSVTAYLEEYYDCPVLLGKNADMYAREENVQILKNRFSSFMELYVGAGIGGGFYFSEESYQGKNEFYPEPGHLCIDYNGPRCSCGNRGCVELYASVPHLLEAAYQVNCAYNKWDALVDGARAGEIKASRLIDRECNYLAALIINIINTIAIEAVVLAGDITYGGTLLADKVQAIVRERVMSKREIPVLVSGLSYESRITAGKNLVYESFLNENMYML